MANVAIYEAGGNKDSSKVDRADKGLRSKFRDYNLKANKDIPENELDRKLVEIEEKRRQSLVVWHQNVMKLHQELWNMSEELEDSLVRDADDDTPERIKRSLQNTKPISEMSEEEINRLPILMRPRPKYPPHKYMFMSKRELRNINDSNFENTMQRLRTDRLVRSDTTLDGTHSRSTQHHHFPSLRTPQYYNILLNPNKHKKSELGDILERAKTMPCAAAPSGNADSKSNINVQMELNGASGKEGRTPKNGAEEETTLLTRRNRSPRKGSSGSSVSGSILKISSPGIARITSGSLTTRHHGSPTKGLGAKSQSVPDLRLVAGDSTENLEGVVSNSNEIDAKQTQEKDLDNIIEEKCKLKDVSKKAKFLKSDKLDDLTDKQFRSRLISHYAKQREDRNALSTLETFGHTERKSLLKIKMADIVTTSQKHLSQNKILKRLQDRRRGEGLGSIHDENAENGNRHDSLPGIHGQSGGVGGAPPAGHSKATDRVELPSISGHKSQPSTLMPSATSKPLDKRKQNQRPMAISFNKNNNNGQPEDGDHNSNSNIIDDSVIMANTNQLNAVVSAISAVNAMATGLPKAQQQQQQQQEAGDVMDDAEKALSVIAEDEIDEEELEDIFNDDIRECKYLRGYDPPQSRPIGDVGEYLFSSEDEPKLKNVAFYHPTIMSGSRKNSVNDNEDIVTVAQ